MVKVQAAEPIIGLRYLAIGVSLWQAGTPAMQFGEPFLAIYLIVFIKIILKKLPALYMH